MHAPCEIPHARSQQSRRQLAVALMQTCDYVDPSPCPAGPVPVVGKDIDYLAAVGQCCESLAALTARIGKPTPYWDTCTATVRVNPLDVLRNEVALQELDSRVAANTVRPTTCVTLANSAAGADSTSSPYTSCRSLLCGSGSSAPGTIRGPVTSRRNQVNVGCRDSACGDAYGWPNAGPSTRDSTWAYGPTAVVSGTGVQGCGLLGQGGFRY